MKPPTLDLLKTGMAQAIDFRIGQILQESLSETVLRKMVMDEVAKVVKETVRVEVNENTRGWLNKGIRQIVETQLLDRLSEGKLTEKIDAALARKFNAAISLAESKRFDDHIKSAAMDKIYGSYQLEQKMRKMVEDKVGERLMELLGDMTSEWADSALASFVKQNQKSKG